jgi:hypothetical protein
MLLKKDFGWAASIIDSKRASNAQDRFKKSARMILLLRADGTLQTFSTASAQLGRKGWRPSLPAHWESADLPRPFQPKGQ